MFLLLTHHWKQRYGQWQLQFDIGEYYGEYFAHLPAISRYCTIKQKKTEKLALLLIRSRVEPGYNVTLMRLNMYVHT